ncbi:tRNA (adenosine(37)-N6)-threonylcarbamoyltransferase complex ATPase subunit type 1 TsaE [Chroococcidiopsis sp. TS-821]|uniref:tRNA (adenosine(37)-N6)-threonylcarbamoyltransferase complex ATPase subunit type 1 TsaE n=1 Tax=Chroococcidiopsis sp. TS-821 TaxID=1378066 RepID=UPI000D445BB5|nr:tRNA (adenosine(37)-N6)-threonylcarbamoyltransferase complex ATPase subunit type 1 TsaE [Chroococcidiopsis sp. TS-821]PPS45977.1 tRNA (adenosine(37)-N6)-threonylcarbamoyltransferase complex ATPase subunit type 1 TsaE [Chroococcidiopsis sp. TS-821]
MNKRQIRTLLVDPQATLRLGKFLGQTLNAGSVLLLQGDLGSGKTTLVQGIGSGLGIKEQIVSPTFTLINEYREGRLPLYHLDLYRLEPESVAALYPEAYWEGIDVELGITAIEWAERLPYLPSSYINIRFSHHNTHGRQVDVSAVGIQLDFLENFTT